MNDHPIIWTQPAPFWSEGTSALVGVAPAEFTRPAILRFTTDNFMEEALNVLATNPGRLGEYRVRPETWRGFLAPAAPVVPRKAFALPFQRLGLARRNLKNGAAALPTQPQENVSLMLPPLKLYGPVAQRYYLVASCLVCQTPGLPDRRIDTAREEKAAVVLRRLFPPGNPDPGTALPVFDEATWEEHAFVAGPRGNFWQKMAATEAARRTVVDGEEHLPLFPMKFQTDDGRDRRLLAGLIPVGRREAYMSAPAAPAAGSSGNAPGTTAITARKTLFRTLVSEPWKALVDCAVSFHDAVLSGDLQGKDPDDVASSIREQIQTASWLILADFASFLRTYLPAVGAPAINPGASLDGAAGALLTALKNTVVSAAVAAQVQKAPNGKLGDVPPSLAHALQRLTPALAQKMDGTVQSYLRDTDSHPDWPDFLFPLVDPRDPTSCLPATGGVALDPGDTVQAPPGAAATFKMAIDQLAALVIRALPAEDATPAPAPSAASQQPADLRDGWFVLRCVYERPACGPLHDDVVSPRSVPFQIAGFFDPDAPARPIRIGLPLDTTPAGLRKFDKNTAFALSDVLCGQVQRMKGLTLGDLVQSVLPFPLHKDLSVPDGGPCRSSGGVNIGTICSLSIPIITLCAFIMLIIIVSLLDIVFRWMPFFILCFPVPGLKAKKS